MRSVKEPIALFIYLIAATILVYYVPVGLNRLLFLLFLILFYRSKKNYLWIAFLFIIIEQPGGLFSGGLRNDQLRLPIYSIMPGFSFAFEQLFVLTALVKARKMRVRFSPVPFLRQNLYRLGMYFLWLLVVTIALGVSFDSLRILYKVIVNLTLFYSLFFLIHEKREFVSFFRLIFPFALIAFFLQLQSITVGHQLITAFKPDVLNTAGVLGNFESQRPIEMSGLLLLTFFGSLYFLTDSKKQFQKNYLLLVNIVSYFAIIITATRSWVIALTGGYILTLLFIPSQSTRLLLKYSLIIILIVVLLFSFVLFKNQYDSAMERITTIGLLAKGDITAGGTLQRYDKRAPAVLNAFKKSTILFGAGFSDHYYRHGDGHVGFHNFLFNTGIVGALLLGLFLYKLVRYTFFLDSQLSSDNPYKNSIKIFPIAVIAMLLLNGGVQVIGYDVGFSRTLIFIVILFYLNNQITNAVLSQEGITNPNSAQLINVEGTRMPVNDLRREQILINVSTSPNLGELKSGVLVSLTNCKGHQ